RGTGMSEARTRGGRAVVIGGGIAGLLAARVLSERYADVTLVERDALAHDLVPRKSAPQGAHVHAVLARGRRIMDSLFPGLTEELAAQGASLVGPKDVRIFILGWRPSFDSSFRILSLTRPCLELNLARRVRALNNVRIEEKTDAVALKGNAVRATGIVVRD